MFRAEDIFWLKEAPGKTLVVGAAYIALDSWRRRKTTKNVKLYKVDMLEASLIRESF